MLLPKGGSLGAGTANVRATYYTRILSPAFHARFPLGNPSYFCDFNYCLDLGPSLG